LRFAPGAMHASHHVTQEWRDKFKYIVGDNGASAEGGPDGTLNEIKGLNDINTSIE